MATTYNHAQIGIVDSAGNVNVIYPITTGADVSISRNNTTIPSTATTAQKLADALGKLAFADSQIDDSGTSTTKTWSSNKINTAITELNSNLKKDLKENLLNNCTIVQEGEDFYIIGADSVRKKLGDMDINVSNIKLGSSYSNHTINSASYISKTGKNIVFVAAGRYGDEYKASFNCTCTNGKVIYIGGCTGNGSGAAAWIINGEIGNNIIITVSFHINISGGFLFFDLE